MKKLTFTMPGKMGDALMQWPVVYQHWKKTGRPAEVWMDEKTCKPLVNLFSSQDGVLQAKLVPGITSWHCGGQPWDFGLKIEDHIDREFMHLGFRQFPTRQITLEVDVQAGTQLDTQKLCQEQSLFVGAEKTVNRCVLHGNFMGQATGVPTFWRFLYDNRRWINETFEEVVFVGKDDELDRAEDIYRPEFPLWQSFRDDGDLLQTAKLMAESRLVLSCGSSMAALANCLKVPCVRVHDPIGDMPKVIWSGTGPNQLNETERELREVFPVWRERWVPRAVVG